MPRVGLCSTLRHESWRARRRCAANIGALRAQNAKLAAANMELAAENSKLAAQCGAVVNTTGTSEALLREGNAHSRALLSSSPVQIRRVTQRECPM